MVDPFAEEAYMRRCLNVELSYLFISQSRFFVSSGMHKGLAGLSPSVTGLSAHQASADLTIDSLPLAAGLENLSTVEKEL